MLIELPRLQYPRDMFFFFFFLSSLSSRYTSLVYFMPITTSVRGDTVFYRTLICPEDDIIPLFLSLLVSAAPPFILLLLSGEEEHE